MISARLLELHKQITLHLKKKKPTPSYYHKMTTLSFVSLSIAKKQKGLEVQSFLLRDIICGQLPFSQLQQLLILLNCIFPTVLEPYQTDQTDP